MTLLHIPDAITEESDVLHKVKEQERTKNRIVFSEKKENSKDDIETVVYNIQKKRFSFYESCKTAKLFLLHKFLKKLTQFTQSLVISLFLGVITAPRRGCY